jgi:hypothetical protein
MRCIFCNKPVLNSDIGNPITLNGIGIAHSTCAEIDSKQKRVFGPICLHDLSGKDLLRLRDLTDLEMKQRNLKHKDIL